MSIHQSPHRQLSAVCQTVLHSDAAAVGLSKVSSHSKWFFVYPFVANSFTDLLTPDLQTLTKVKKIKCGSHCTDPFP